MGRARGPKRGGCGAWGGWPAAALALLPFALGGCAFHRANVEKKLMATRSGSAEVQDVGKEYRVGCPDVLEVSLAHAPERLHRLSVGADGRIDVPGVGPVAAEGRTPPEVAAEAARRAGLSPRDVAVRVAEYRSRDVYLLGQVAGSHQSVPYQGPETVLALLQRAGGITPGAEPRDVYVIRSHVPEDRRPEVFHVDLRAIVVDKDHATNIRVQPFDQVHIGETRQALIERVIPPWCRPLHRVLWDTRPADSPPRRVIGHRLSAARREWAERRDD